MKPSAIPAPALTLTVLTVCLAACTSTPPQPQAPAGSQKAAPPAPLIDDPRQSYFITSYADESTLRMAFQDAQQHKNDGEQGESACLRLHALLLAAGDELFASSLLREPLPVRRAVAGLMVLDRLGPGYPQTSSALLTFRESQ